MKAIFILSFLLSSLFAYSKNNEVTLIHTKVSQVNKNNPVFIEANVTNVHLVNYILIHYKYGEDELWNNVEMNGNDGKLIAEIPQSDTEYNEIYYYIEVFDNNEKVITQFASMNEPQSIKIKEDGNLNKSIVVKTKDKNIEFKTTAEDFEIYISEIMNQEVTVATKKKTTLRETPGIVSVITKDDIKKSGARDLIDILIKVPGFNFGVDVHNLVSLGIRGNWANEGKVLLLFNGHEMNELIFATIQLGNHFPVDTIKKIEIIRGPGSSVYGGFAELAVINIITEDGEDLKGINFSSSAGQFGLNANEYSHRNGIISAGLKNDDLKMSTLLFYGQANRSNKTFKDFYPDNEYHSYNMTGKNQMIPGMIDVSLSYKGFEAKFLYDRYEIQTQDAYYYNLPDSMESIFYSYFAEIKYDLKIGKNLTITPSFNYKRQLPWNATSEFVKEIDLDKENKYDGAYSFMYYDVMVERFVPSLLVSYDFMEKNNILFGVEYTYDKFEILSVLRDEDLTKTDYQNTAAFGQILFNTKYVNITAGARYDYHSKVGGAFVPRIALTKAFDKISFKLLASRAFRQPSIANIEYYKQFEALPEEQRYGSIKPETTTVLEFETGFNFTKYMFLTANIFQIDIKDPIVYYEDGDEYYDNFESTGSRGFELEYLLKLKKLSFNLNYSYYKTYKNKVDYVKILKDDSLVVGLPAHKVTFNTNINIYKSLFFNIDGVFMSEKYGYTSVDSEDNSVIEKLDNTFLLNAYLFYDNLFIEGLYAGFGVHNILNSDYLFVQPYNGYHAPLPGLTRDFTLKIGYNYKF